MRSLRNIIPILGIIALTALFLKMPEAPNVFGIFKCDTCVGNTPYLPMIGAGYFAILLAISMLFPSFPNLSMAHGGLIWAVLLFFVLTSIDFPQWCPACIIGHLCNISIWMIWWLIPSTTEQGHASPFRERLFLMLFAPIAMITLFGCLNLTFMIYHLKSSQSVMTTNLKAGDLVPNFKIKNDKDTVFANSDITAASGTFINFVSSNCPYCKEQLAILNDASTQLANESYRFINISPSLSQDLIQQSSSTSNGLHFPAFLLALD